MPSLSDFWDIFQVRLFQRLKRVLEDPQTEKRKRFIHVLDVVVIEKAAVEEYIANPPSQWMGR